MRDAKARGASRHRYDEIYSDTIEMLKTNEGCICIPLAKKAVYASIIYSVLCNNSSLTIPRMVVG